MVASAPPIGSKYAFSYVGNHTTDDYADALGRGIPVSLLVTQTTGMLCCDTVRMLLTLAARQAGQSPHHARRHVARARARRAARTFGLDEDVATFFATYAREKIIEMSRRVATFARKK